MPLTAQVSDSRIVQLLLPQVLHRVVAVRVGGVAPGAVEAVHVLAHGGPIGGAQLLVLPHLLERLQRAVVHLVAGVLQNALLHVHTKVCIHTRRYACKDVFVYPYICILVHVHIHVYVHKYIHTYIHTYMYTFIHIHIHIYVYTYIYIYMYVCLNTTFGDLRGYLYTCVYM